MGIIGLISLLQQLHFFKRFRHRWCCHHPGHWWFLLKGLWVCSIVPYHNNCFFTALLSTGCVYSVQWGPVAKSHLWCARLVSWHWCGPFLSSLLLCGKRRTLWSLHSGHTLTNHSHLEQVPSSGHHLPPWSAFYALIWDVLPWHFPTASPTHPPLPPPSC